MRMGIAVQRDAMENQVGIERRDDLLRSPICTPLVFKKCS
jgi:hypothetical protein